MSTLAADIDRTLALEILRGERAPGSTLPSIRALATQFETTVPTIQRAVDRLASTGLVTPKHGSGVVVNDPETCGDPSLVPLWFEAFADRPERARQMLADFLELRRVVAGHLVRTRLPQLMTALPALAELAATVNTDAELRSVALADSKITRVVVDAADNFAVKAVFTSIEKMALEVPAAAEALYGDREAHRATLAQVVGAIATSPDAQTAARALEDALAAWDARTVARFKPRS